MRTFIINIRGFTIFQKQRGVGIKWRTWPSFHTLLPPNPSLTTAYQGPITSLCLWCSFPGPSTDNATQLLEGFSETYEGSMTPISATLPRRPNTASTQAPPSRLTQSRRASVILNLRMDSESISAFVHHPSACFLSEAQQKTLPRSNPRLFSPASPQPGLPSWAVPHRVWSHKHELPCSML